MPMLLVASFDTHSHEPKVAPKPTVAPSAQRRLLTRYSDEWNLERKNSCLEAMALRLEAIALRFEAIASKLEAI